MTRVACCRIAPRLGDLAANRERVLRALSAAAADVVVLPELVTSGYAFA
jgi:5-aminopentanamidase